MAGRRFLSFKVPHTEKACWPRLWVMAAAYRELHWSLLSSTQENEEALSPHPLEGMDVKQSVPGDLVHISLWLLPGPH